MAVKVGRGVGQLWTKWKDWDTKLLRRLFRFSRKDEGTWSGYRLFRNMIKLLFLHEIIAEGRWVVMGVDM